MSKYLSAALVARLFCGYTLIVCALTTFGLYNGPMSYSWMNFDYAIEFDSLRFPVVVLMSIFAIWLMIGIRTRIIAFCAMVLVTCLILFEYTAPYSVTGPAALWEILFATAFLFGLLYLVLRGGGETALVRGGWEGLF